MLTEYDILMLHKITTHSVFDDDYVSKISILPIITQKVPLKLLPTCIFPFLWGLLDGNLLDLIQKLE